jgi:hypothetical protein
MHPDYLFRRTEASNNKQTRRSAQHQSCRVRGGTRSSSGNRSSVAHTHRHEQGNSVAQDYKTNFITENERDCPRPRPGWAKHLGGGGDVDIQPAAGLGGLPLSPSHRASCIGQDGRSDAARCSNYAASHCTNLTGATATHVRRERTRRAVTQPTHSPLIALG